MRDFASGRKAYVDLVELDTDQTGLAWRAYLDTGVSYALEGNYAQAKREYNRILLAKEAEPAFKRRAEDQLKLVVLLEDIEAKLKAARDARQDELQRDLEAQRDVVLSTVEKALLPDAPETGAKP